MATQNGIDDISPRARDELFRWIESIDTRKEREILLSIEALLKQLVAQGAHPDRKSDE